MRVALTPAPVLLVAALLAAPAAAQETRAFTDGQGRSVEIPVEPERIVSLNAQSVTVFLHEVGVEPVGSAGALDETGTLYLRAMEELYGIDYGDADIVPVGTWGAYDLEAIAALEPDLIIDWGDTEPGLLARLERIAPVVLTPTSGDWLEIPRVVADAAGRLEEHEILRARFERLVEEARGWMGDAAGQTYAVLGAYDGELYLASDWDGLSPVAEALGLVPHPLVADMRARRVPYGENLSFEVLPSIDADVTFDVFDLSQGEGPQDRIDAFAAVLPSWCDALPSCARGQHVILPREHTGLSFRELELLVFHLVTHLAGRPGAGEPR
jgi:iron complex transport system substrate-binding protein